MKDETSAGIVVFVGLGSNRKYLVLHYEEGHFDLPKGHLEGGETPEDAAVRETKEETGLDVEILQGFKESISYQFTGREGQKIRKKVIFFTGEAKTENVVLSHEHIGFKWLSFEDALKELTFDSAKNMIRKAESFLNKIV